jgi:ornithine cyclodeaminase/alanine dehydrogenase-like protein (mu-crystallin family)
MVAGLRHSLLIDAGNVRRIAAEYGISPLMDELMNRLLQTLSTFDDRLFESPPRDGFGDDGNGLIEWMPIHERDHTVTLKVVGYHPLNPTSHGLPSVLSSISVYDSQSGHLLALADGTFITAWRTGAMSGVASRLLAEPGSATVGLIGCGAQAVTQLHAVSMAFDIQSVLLHDIDQDRVQTLPERARAFAGPDMMFKSLPPEEMLAACDIICTSTSNPVGAGPLFEDAETKAWLHINAVGSDFPGKRELPVSLLKRSLVVADFLPQAVREGETQQLHSGTARIVSLPDIVRHDIAGADYRNDLTVFDSTGWALADHVAMALIVELAVEMDEFRHVQLDNSGFDPYSPYEELSTPPLAPRIGY